jgi:hypothetical protein
MAAVTPSGAASTNASQQFGDALTEMNLPFRFAVRHDVSAMPVV